MSVLSHPNLTDVIGEEVVSDWIMVDQAMINQFADVTGDHQFIHIDPERAAMTPFGQTVAHGFLTLSLLPRFMAVALPDVSNAKMVLNYGTNHLRFVSPVRSGKRVRGHIALKQAQEKHSGQIEIVHSISVEIEGETKPALVTDWITLVIV